MTFSHRLRNAPKQSSHREFVLLRHSNAGSHPRFALRQRYNTSLQSFLPVIFFLLSFALYAQNQPTEKIYGEHLHVHLNNTFFVTGETLLFSIHCHTSDHRISTLSSIAYLELIGENQKPVFQIKISLTKGAGSGDFFLPATLPAGNYTLVGYTKWMKNFPVSEFSRQIITVINPFLKADGVARKKSTFSDVGEKSTSAIPAADIIKLTIPQRHVRIREKINVSLKNADSLEQVTLSISVRMMDKKFTLYESSTNVLAETSRVHSAEADNGVRYLPDFRGELISGKAVNKTTRKPLAHAIVYLSAPSKNFIFKTARTDSLGRFFFSIENSGSSPTLLLRLASEDHREFEIERTPEFLNDYEYFSPPPLTIDTSFRRAIERRNLYSQVENAYYEVKKDSITVSSHSKPFFGKPDKVYMLDEYARFATMEDVFREYIPEIVVKKKNEKFELQLVSSLSSIRLTGTPLILLDGIPVPDADIIMKYNPLNIQRIEIVARRYFYSALQTDGIISIATYEGNAKELSISEMIPLTYTAPQPAKIYFSPSYSEKSLVRIPDYRTQLFWKPALTLIKGSEQRIDFFASDVTGNFIISVEGFTTSGRYLKTEEVIEVVGEKQ